MVVEPPPSRLMALMQSKALKIWANSAIVIPADCSVTFQGHGGSPAIQLSYDSPFIIKAKSALSDEWSKPAVMIAMGGSIPIVGDFQTYLGMESLLVGFGLSDDRIHSLILGYWHTIVTPPMVFARNMVEVKKEMEAKGISKPMVASLAGDVEVEEAAEYLYQKHGNHESISDRFRNDNQL